MSERCVNCNEPIVIRKAGDIRVFHAFPYTAFPKRAKCKKAEWKDRFK